MKKISEKILFDGQWISLHEMVYQNKEGDSIRWEAVRRKKSKVGVVIVAKLIPSQRFVMIKQFRPAVGGYILGFPAGLADGNPDHALVELKEETGFVGRIKSISPVLKVGSSLIDDCGQIIYVEVDEHAPQNQNPKQKLEAAEDIEVCLVKKEDAQEFLLKQQAKGMHISSNLWYLFGLSEMAT